MTLCVNDVIRSLDPVTVGFAGLHRVLFLDCNHVHLMGLERPWCMPRAYSLKRINELMQQGKLDTVGFEGHSYSLRNEDEIPSTAVKAGNDAWSWIEPLVDPQVVWELFDQDLRARNLTRWTERAGSPKAACCRQ